MPRIKTNADIPDIQNTIDGFPKIAIPKVGVRGIKVPIQVVRKNGTINSASADISIYSDLSPENKGTNMSRYRILVEECVIDKQLNVKELVPTMLDLIKERLKSQNAYIKVSFDYFITQEAPVSKLKSHMELRATIEGKLVNGEKKLYLTVKSPYTSLCPCSKEISDYGAHNQRSASFITVEMIPDQMIWIEDLYDVTIKCASAPIINGLKRVDEAYQTELMYENPKFVEDMVRDISVELNQHYLDKSIKDYVIVVEHWESIHTQDAVYIIHANRELR